MLKNSKTILIFLILAIGLSACGVQSTIEASPIIVENEAETATEAVSVVATKPAAAVEPVAETTADTISYPIVETGQGLCYGRDGAKITCPAEGEAFYGQDAQFSGNAFSFTDNGNGTVTDNVTGLLWQQTPDSDYYSWNDAHTYCEKLSLGGSDDWRMPSLKELFSLSNFSAGWPYLDLTYFQLTRTDGVSKDEQYWGNSHYVGKTSEGGYDAAFGVNHATGHIKAYPAATSGGRGKHVRCVSGAEYGLNQFVDNGNGTISDEATGLMWSQADSGEGMDWEAALAYAQAQNEANYLGYSDWRLPNVKEIQSIANYSYAPDAQDAAYDGPALDPIFSVSEITNEAGASDYPYYWTSTSARFQSGGDFYYAWYFAAGRAVGPDGIDTHGAGAVRFSTKYEGGPAGEDAESAERDNYVRLVRGGNITESPEGDPNANDVSPKLGDGAGGQPGGQPGGQQGGQQGRTIDFAAAAETLGITEEALMEALGDPSQGAPDFAAAAATLGITEEALTEALGISAGGAPNKQPPGGGHPPSNGG